jgi:hypothetical protein
MKGVALPSTNRYYAMVGRHVSWIVISRWHSSWLKVRPEVGRVMPVPANAGWGGKQGTPAALIAPVFVAPLRCPQTGKASSGRPAQSTARPRSLSPTCPPDNLRNDGSVPVCRGGLGACLDAGRERPTPVADQACPNCAALLSRPPAASPLVVRQGWALPKRDLILQPPLRRPEGGAFRAAQRRKKCEPSAGRAEPFRKAQRRSRSDVQTLSLIWTAPVADRRCHNPAQTLPKSPDDLTAGWPMDQRQPCW